MKDTTDTSLLAQDETVNIHFKLRSRNVKTSLLSFIKCVGNEYENKMCANEQKVWRTFLKFSRSDVFLITLKGKEYIFMIVYRDTVQTTQITIMKKYLGKFLKKNFPTGERGFLKIHTIRIFFSFLTSKKTFPPIVSFNS